MIRNYIKIAFRNFFRNKLNSFINLLGLSLGLAACILITMYVSHEKTYDQFHDEAERIFKVAGEFKMQGSSTLRMSNFSAVVGPQLKEKSPYVEDAFRYHVSRDPVTITLGESESQIFYEKKLFAADSNFFSFFSFDLIKGSPSEALVAPMSAVLAASTAEKYFGTADPIGKQISIKQDSTYNFTVTGIAKEFPTNSSIKPDVIISMSTLSLMKETKDIMDEQLFQGGSFKTFLRLNQVSKKASIQDIALKLDRLSYEKSTTTYLLEPFTESYALARDTGRFDYLNVFPIVAFLILILALTNYISLTTARASKRSKEVGVRKISGANRSGLALQFYIESAIFVSISFVLGLCMSYLFKPSFLQLLDIEISNSFFLDSKFILALSGLFVFTVLISGVYPAMVLSSFNPIKNFRNKLNKNSGSVVVRKVFTTLQFSIAVVLIVCGIVMGTQLGFMSEKDTGLDRSNLLIIPIEKTMNSNTNAFRNDVEKIPGVEETAIAQYGIYDPYGMFFITPPNKDESFPLVTFSVDENFINTLDISWYLEPKELNPTVENGKIIINEKSISEYGLLPDPRGEKLAIGNQSLEIVGVVKDFNYTSLENPINPLAFFVNTKASSNKYATTYGQAKMYIKYKRGISISDLISQVESRYISFDKTASFSYEFMDDVFDANYRAERQLSFIFYVFIVLALVIAGLGLFGLVAFALEQRVKEIGIRKVLGASISEIIMLVSKDFLALVLLAILIASPIAWYFSDSWLNYFSYRIDVPWWSFAIAAAMALVIAFLTMSFQATKAAIANPVDSLKTE